MKSRSTGIDVQMHVSERTRAAVVRRRRFWRSVLNGRQGSVEKVNESVATRTRYLGLDWIFGAAPKMDVEPESSQGPPWSASRRRPQTASMLLRSKGVVVSNRGKGSRKGCQVSIEKMSASEPSMTHRNHKQLPKPRAHFSRGMSLGEVLCNLTRWQPVYRRHELSAGFGDGT